MSDLIKLVVTVAKNAGIAFLLLLFVAFLSRGDSKEEAEAKRLGFDDVVEMEQIHGKGWHTKAQYIADETARAKRLGFKDIEELQEADSVGALNKQAYVRYLREKEQQDALANGSGGAGSESATYRTPNQGLAVGRYSFSSLVNSGHSACPSDETCMSLDQYKQICAKVSHIPVRGGSLAFFGQTGYDVNVGALLRSGGATSAVGSSWRVSPDSSQGGCQISVNVSGIYEGTSTRGTAVAFADTFRVDDEGDVIAVSGPGSLVWLK